MTLRGGAEWNPIADRKHDERRRPSSTCTKAKNNALAEALTSRGVDKDSIAAAIGDLLARRVAGQNAGTTLAPIFAGVGLGAVDR